MFGSGVARRSAEKKMFCDLEHSKLAGNTATFTAVITLKSRTCVQNMVWIEAAAEEVVDMRGGAPLS